MAVLGLAGRELAGDDPRLPEDAQAVRDGGGTTATRPEVPRLPVEEERISWRARTAPLP